MVNQEVNLYFFGLTLLALEIVLLSMVVTQCRDSCHDIFTANDTTYASVIVINCM